MSWFKSMMYDWGGYNWLISQKIHLLLQNKFAISTLYLFSQSLGKVYFFPIHVFLLSIAIAWIIRRSKNNQMATTMIYMKHFCLLLINMSVGLAIALGIKYSLQYPRPFCKALYNLNEHMMYFLKQKQEVDCIKVGDSFPSGHVVYLLLFITSFWSVMSAGVKKLSVAAVIVMMISRVALGYHFLADTVYACLVVLFVAYPLSKLILNHYFSKYEPAIKHFLKSKYLR